MTGSITEGSARRKARLAGVFYLGCIVAGLFAAFAGGKFAAYGDAVFVLGTLFYVAVTLLLYGIFKPVNSGLSLLAALFSLAGCAATILSLYHLIRLPINSMVFFGFYCLLLAYLILRSTFMPRIIGMLMVFPGVGWLMFLWPSLAHSISMYIMGFGLLGEGALTVWLLAKGVDDERWRQQASSRAAH